MTVRILTAAIFFAGSHLAAAGAPRVSLEKIPMHFEPASDGQYVARAGSYAVRLAGESAVISMPDGVASLEWLGAMTDPAAMAEERLPGVSHYFLGNDPAAWRSGVPHFRRVRVRDLYPGIDAVYYGRGRSLEFDLELRPGADPEMVRFRFSGAEADPSGALSVRFRDGVLQQLAPEVYQVIEGERRPVSARYVEYGGFEFGFALDEYDAARTLVIDPVLVYSTYVGGGQLDVVNAVAVNANGEVFVTGESHSPDFPAPSFAAGPMTGNPPGNVFVTKLTADGTSILSSAFFGGSSRDAGLDLAVGVDGFIHVTGYTQSDDFPVTVTAAQPAIGDKDSPEGDAFVVRLISGGSTLLYSSYLGGERRDEGRGITFGAGGDMFITGLTTSPDFPVTDGAFQTTYHGPEGADGFVTQLLSAGPGIVFSTYLGGSNNDAGNGIALDTDGYAYVTGSTESPDFPTRAAAQPALAGDGQFVWADAFITKLMPDGTGVMFSTFIGGSRGDAGNALSLDRETNVYIAGETGSTDFPVTAGALQTQNGDGGAAADAFVARLNRSGSRLDWATYYGGDRTDFAHDMAVTPSGEVTIAGETDSSNLVTGDSDCNLSFAAGGRDAFVARILAGGATLGFASYLGGAGADRALGVAVDEAGNAYLGGSTDSPGFPTTGGALRAVVQQAEGFIAKVSPAAAGAPRCISVAGIVNAAGYQSGAVSPGEIVVIYGKEIGPEDLIPGRVVANKFTNDLAQTQVFFGEVAAPIIYAYRTQVSAIVPYSVSVQPTINVRILRHGTFSNEVHVPVVPSMPGIFSLDSSGQGQGAVLHPDYSVNGPANPMDRGGIVILYTTGEGLTDPPGEDGQLAMSVYPKPRLPVSVRIGGVEAEILYAGAAPELVAGVMQVNVRVPGDIEPGDNVPVLLKVGDRVSQPGITIAVR